MSHSTHMNESWHTWMCHSTHMNESQHTYERVAAHMWMNLGTHSNEFWYTFWTQHATHACRALFESCLKITGTPPKSVELWTFVGFWIYTQVHLYKCRYICVFWLGGGDSISSARGVHKSWHILWTSDLAHTLSTRNSTHAWRAWFNTRASFVFCLSKMIFWNVISAWHPFWRRNAILHISGFSHLLQYMVDMTHSCEHVVYSQHASHKSSCNLGIHYGQGTLYIYIYIYIYIHIYIYIYMYIYIYI